MPESVQKIEPARHAATLPRRSAQHGPWGLASILLFQLVVMAFGAMLVAGSAGIAPDWVGRGLPEALHRGLLITLPLAALGAILGLIDYLQLTRRRLLGTLGLMLNSMHVLLCLVLLRG